MFGDIIYNLLSDGMSNHMIKFSEFMYFAANFKLSIGNQNNIIFNIISSKNKYIKIQDLMRIFV